eukprot:Seg1091.3 transcript_id=Seg1091.3/GoldUCD/mRNA.D3Y31 product="hypothetical protein" protein_id=Seg1091.3/GoldUCD/D3Y31
MVSQLEANEELFSKTKDSSLYNFITKSEVQEIHRKDILTCESIGQAKYSEFVKERMAPDSTKGIWEPLKMLKLGTFSSMNKRTKVQAGKRIIELKQSRGLLGRLALVCKSSREFELKEMIGTYELQVVRRGLMLSDGNLHPGHEGKSQLLQSLEKLCKEKEETESITSVESIVIIDAMVIVQKIAPKPSWVKTVEDILKIF